MTSAGKLAMDSMHTFITWRKGGIWLQGIREEQRGSVCMMSTDPCPTFKMASSLAVTTRCDLLLLWKTSHYCSFFLLLSRLLLSSARHPWQCCTSWWPGYWMDQCLCWACSLSASVAKHQRPYHPEPRTLKSSRKCNWKPACWSCCLLSCQKRWQCNRSSKV